MATIPGVSTFRFILVNATASSFWRDGLVAWSYALCPATLQISATPNHLTSRPRHKAPEPMDVFFDEFAWILGSKLSLELCLRPLRQIALSATHVAVEPIRVDSGHEIQYD